MEIETLQNIVLIGLGMVIFVMYVTSKAFDEISNEIDEKKRSL